MNIADIALPEVYLESSDFRLFIKWFAAALSKVQYDTENLPDLYDPLRCPDNLLWMLADTMGFKYDDRLPTAFNRLVLIYFMSMIRNRGSKDGMTLAAEVNLAQFNVIDYGKENEILYNRLEDTSIPVNSAYVTPHVAEGYIDVVYFSEKAPVDACIEYVRPLGMYLFASPGVRCDARTKISIDARLTNIYDEGMSIGPTRVGHYSRKDYSSIQKVSELPNGTPTEGRSPAWLRNSVNENLPVEQGGKGGPTVNAGYRALSSLQLCNNEHIVKSLIPSIDPDVPPIERGPIFGLGYTPTEVDVFNDNLPLMGEDGKPYTWNLRYDRGSDIAVEVNGRDVYPVATLEQDTAEGGRQSVAPIPTPRINPIMSAVGDAIVMDTSNTRYTKVDGIEVLSNNAGEDIITKPENTNVDVSNNAEITIIDINEEDT